MFRHGDYYHRIQTQPPRLHLTPLSSTYQPFIFAFKSTFFTSLSDLLLSRDYTTTVGDIAPELSRRDIVHGSFPCSLLKAMSFGLKGRVAFALGSNVWFLGQLMLILIIKLTDL